jgi:hypothetical protein
MQIRLFFLFVCRATTRCSVLVFDITFSPSSARNTELYLQFSFLFVLCHSYKQEGFSVSALDIGHWLLCHIFVCSFFLSQRFFIEFETKFSV